MARKHKKRTKSQERPLDEAPSALPTGRAWSRSRTFAALAMLLALVTLAYSNHFHNSFHFDDYHAIVNNPHIRDLHDVGGFFTDARTTSILPANQAYRPLLTLSFAVDYWMVHGLDPFWFHLSNYFWYVVQLVLMFSFLRRVFDAALPDPRNAWVALFATAVYGLHPAMAETVNYIVQRGDLYSTLAVVAAFSIYISAPGLRRYGLYLLPVIAGLFAKQPAAVFPALLFAWIWLFEAKDLKAAVIKSLPAFLVTGAVALLVLRMNSATFTGGAASAYNYRISQPSVLLSYFRRFFFPYDLSADTDRKPLTSLLSGNAICGVVFVVLLCGAIFWCRRRRETRPISFGFFWFLVACAPTSWIPLAEVENDHRLFFPFVGLAMGVCWAFAIWIYRHPPPLPAVAGACALLLGAETLGTHERNIVWHSDDSLWLDVTHKSPGNGRGLMNYGLSQMSKGSYAAALDYFDRALVLNPNYFTLEINLGVAYGALKKNEDAERHFLRAIRLAPTSADARMYYARWLNATGRSAEAIRNLRLALREQPDHMESRYLLMQIYANLGDRDELAAQAAQALAMFPSDTQACNWLKKAPTLPQRPPALASKASVEDVSAESCLNQSLALYTAGKYPESIAAAREALKLKPNYAEAWNNIMAAYDAMSDWDDGIAAGEKALSINPSFELAQNNLAWARAQKEKSAAPHR
jgi:protein O-mannosyl-transferase